MEGVKDLFAMRARITLTPNTALLIVEDHPATFSFADASFVGVSTAFAIFHEEIF